MAIENAKLESVLIFTDTTLTIMKYCVNETPMANFNPTHYFSKYFNFTLFWWIVYFLHYFDKLVAKSWKEQKVEKVGQN